MYTLDPSNLGTEAHLSMKGHLCRGLEQKETLFEIWAMDKVLTNRQLFAAIESSD